MHGTQSPFYFFLFNFIDYKLNKFVWVLAIMWILYGSYMHKGQEEANVKASYKFGNNLMKCVLNTKQDWRLIVELKIWQLCFYHIECHL
jgi:L-rhamnose isomerase